MPLTLSGILRDGFNQPLANAEIQFQAVRTSASVIGYSNASATSNASGQYTATVQDGTYDIYIRVGQNAYVLARGITISSQLTAATLNDLIIEWQGVEGVDSAVMVEFRSLTATARNYRDQAASSAERSEASAVRAETAAQSIADAPPPETNVDLSAYSTTAEVETFVDRTLDIERRSDIPFRVDHVYVLGASVLYQAFTENANAELKFADLIEQTGLPRPTINTDYAIAGDDSADYLESLPQLLAATAELDNVLVVIHGPGNDVSELGPWPGGADLIQTNMEQLLSSIVDAGHRVMFSDITYRVPPASNPTQPYNEAIIYPLIRKYSPEFWRDGRPLYDLYSLTNEYQSHFTGDGIHPDDPAQGLIRAYTARKLYEGVTRTFSRIDKETAQGHRVLVRFANDYLFDATVGTNNASLSAETGTSGSSASYWLTSVRDIDGTILPGVTMSTLGVSGWNYAGRGVGDTTQSITNAALTGNSMFTDGTQRIRTVFHGLPNGLSGILSVTGSRNASDIRNTEITVDGITQAINTSAATPEVVQFAFTVVNNQLVIEWGPATGTTFAYISALQLDFMAASSDGSSSIMVVTQDEYDALDPDPNTIYYTV